MRNSGFQIEPSKFRNTGTFIVSSLRPFGNSNVPSKIQLRSKLFYFSSGSGSGLKKSFEADLNVDSNWIQSDTEIEIVTRYNKSFLDDYQNKNLESKVLFNGNRYSVLKMIDLNLEQIYLVMHLKLVK